MKTSMKILTASVALAMSGVANAAILQSNGTAGSGELFLTAWDRVGQQSYSLDLGILEADFVANTSQTLSYDLSGDTNFAPFLGNTSVVFTVTGGDDSFLNTTTGAIDGSRFGYVTTSVSSYDQIYLAAQTQAIIGGVVASIDNMALNSNTAAGDLLDPSLNLSSYSVPGEFGYFGDATWSIDIGGKSFVAAGLVDTDIPFYFASLDAASNYTLGVLTELPNVWNLTSTGQLTYAAPSAVPVPAAVWLFGSGLLGLVSVARRRKA